MTGAGDEQEMGARLAAGRAAVGLSIRRAAKVAGIPATLWADLERGERSTPGMPVDADDDTVVRVARAVGLDPVDLFDALGREAPAIAPIVAPRPPPVVADLEARLVRTEAAIEVLAERLGIAPEDLWGPGGR